MFKQSRVQEKELENETKELDLEVECSIKESDTREQQIEFKCNDCSYQSNFKKELKAHMKIHKKKTGKEGFKCDECEFSCKCMTTLIKHKKTQSIL